MLTEYEKEFGMFMERSIVAEKDKAEIEMVFSKRKRIRDVK